MNTFKKLTAMVIAVMLTLSMCITGISASAVSTEEADPDAFYLFGYIDEANYGCEDDSSNAGDYKFVDNTLTVAFQKNSYVAVKKGDNSAWYMTEGWLGENVTEAILKNTKDIASGANKLFVPAGYEITFTLVDNGDDSFTLSYTIGEEVETTEGTTTAIIEGDPDSYYLFGYINGANYACENNSANAGIYKFENNQLTAKFEKNSYVAVKKGDNSAWYMTEGWLGEKVTEALLKNTNDIASGANRLFVPAGVEVTFTLVDNGDDTFTLSYASAINPTGETDPTEATTVPSTEPVDPTVPVDPTEPTEPVEVDYYLFGSINGADYGTGADYKNMGDYKFVNNEVTVTFTETSYVGVKTTNNANWYMTDGWQGDVTEVTLFNTADLDETANKLMVPAGEVKFTLTVNDDDTLTLSYTVLSQPVEPVTVYFAAPRVAPGRTVWSDVDIYYNDTTSVIKSNRIHMTDTGLVIDNPAGANLKTTRRGNWHVFSAELTADQVNAIDSAKYAGFVYAGNYNLKTSAKFDIKMGGSIADFDGQVFLIDGAVTNSEVDSYTGAWTTEQPVAPEYTATTLKFACPTQNWSGGVYFYYGDSSVITTVTKLEMTPSGKTLAVSDSLVSSLTKYVGGNWEVYTLELTAEQVEIIDNSSVSGFCSGSSIYVKTSSARNVFRDYNSVSDLANYAFVATNCTNAAQERASLTGKWRWCKL